MPLWSGAFRARPARWIAGILAVVPLMVGAAPRLGAPVAPARVGAKALANPILFVTQVPIPDDYTTIGSVFGNHRAEVDSAGRGGDLYIQYPSGTLRNLTREAGFGNDGFQGAGSIAVREPSVHWTGSKALFSMVVGAPTEQFRQVTTYWQIYEITGLAEGGHAVITRIAQQPANANNVSPLYSPDGRILFTSDRPRDGQAQLYPQLDEYEEAPSTSGLWSLDPASGDLRLLDHAPSGVFRPLLDSFGRVVYTRWDHLQRDQQADSDVLDGGGYGTFNYSDESAGAARLTSRDEIFPEPRAERQDLLAGTPFEGHSFNHFFPWQINPDGTEHETLNHIGRHELHEYFNRDRHDDDQIVEFVASVSGRFNPNSIESMLQIQEDPRTPGRYLGVEAPEFQTHASGRIVALNAPVGLAADHIPVTYVTHPSTLDVTDEGGTSSAGSTGHYRNPLPLADGSLLAVHSDETRADTNTGTRQTPGSRYAFRIKSLVPGSGGYLTAGAPLTAGIRKTISYWDPDEMVTFSGELWELDPVEVRARPAPPVRTAAFEAPEQGIFTQEGVDPEAFRSWLRANGLAVMVSRNVTTRDEADRQQPFNLQVAGGGAKTTGSAGTLYQVSHLQIFQGDLLRGLGGVADPRPGRRVLAQILHDQQVRNPASAGPAGSVDLAADGSMAAFVPSRRALTWQLTDGAGQGVVRERYWLTFQPGEIRVCTSCHGVNSHDQQGRTEPTNPPEALRTLLRYWKTNLGGGTGGGGCQPGPTTLCLGGGRFKVEAAWKDFAGHTGVGQTLPLTGDTGAFWFFDPTNIEVILKVLDGRSLNAKFWVFYGALSNVEYTLTVTDTTTGAVKTYHNPSGTFASAGDTQALPGGSAASVVPSAIATFPSLPAHQPGAWATKAGCVAGPTALCLNGGRFRVEIAWKDFTGRTGAGQASPLTGDTGTFWFFDAANVEVVAKVLDGRALNGKWWFFFGALSNVEYTITVTDTATGAFRTYKNPAGQFASAGDTAAFPAGP
jgi:hypothetical protein